ncbi:MAG: hypothetical protein WCJ24_02025 [Candidatus Saccharibacteria bacterium]
MKQSFYKFIGTYWHQILIYGMVAAFVGAVLWYQLGTLVPGFSLPELTARSEVNSLHKLIANPLFLPHKLIQYAFIRLGKNGPFWMRSASALWGLGVILLSFDIIRTWYSRRIAVMSSLLLITSAWFLHFARLGTPLIMFTSSIGLIWVGMKLKSVSAPRIRTIMASILILEVCLYVPGLAWLVVPLLFWQRQHIWFEISKIPKFLGWFTITAVIVGLVPLINGFIRSPILVRDWLMLPSRFNLGLFWSNAWHLPIWFTFKGPELPVYWLGHLPMFNSFSLIMGMLGVYVLFSYRLLDRVRVFFGIFFLAVVLTIFNGWLALVIALPVFYIFVAAGIALFLQQWFTVFPRNPLARAAGITAVAFVIILACFYNTQSYFVAWPRNFDTRQVFNLKS